MAICCSCFIAWTTCDDGGGGSGSIHTLRLTSAWYVSLLNEPIKDMRYFYIIHVSAIWRSYMLWQFFLLSGGNVIRTSFSVHWKRSQNVVATFGFKVDFVENKLSIKTTLSMFFKHQARQQIKSKNADMQHSIYDK